MFAIISAVLSLGSNTNTFSWQSLLSDRDQLCQLLEQHPKLMQMLQVI